LNEIEIKKTFDDLTLTDEHLQKLRKEAESMDTD